MSAPAKSGLQAVFNELKNPWDWTAAALGGAAGALATIFLHGADLGHSIPTGALAAVGARKAGVASLQKRTLAARAKALARILGGNDGQAATPFSNRPIDIDLQEELRDLEDKWRSGIFTNAQFERGITAVAKQHSKRKKTFARKFLLTAGVP